MSSVVDSYWLNQYCINGLIDIENVSYTIAKEFCRLSISEDIIGHLKDYKFASAEIFISAFT